MQVDTFVILQGIVEACDAKEISHTYYMVLSEKIKEISRTMGEDGRPQCDYDKLLEVIGLAAYDARIEEITGWREYAMFWKRFGTTISLAISMANG